MFPCDAERYVENFTFYIFNEDQVSVMEKENESLNILHKMTNYLSKPGIYISYEKLILLTYNSIIIKNMSPAKLKLLILQNLKYKSV